MTKEERELRREQREHMKRMEAAAKEAGRGPIDVPFLLLVLLLTGVGLIMLLSASFPSAYYESGDPLYYFKRQAAFATLGLAAMVVIGRINYARFRGVAKIALGISIALLVAVIIPASVSRATARRAGSVSRAPRCGFSRRRSPSLASSFILPTASPKRRTK